MEKITVYTKDTCDYCKQVKNELNNKEINFEEKKTKDYKKEWLEIVDLTAMPLLPTIEYNEEYFVPGRDFSNANQLIERLQSFNSSSFSKEKRSLERIKTLSYNISAAFGKLDQLLRKIENKLNIKENEHKSTN